MPMTDARLADLMSRIAGCTACAGSLPLGPKPVLQVGSGAPILIVGQAPGKRAHHSGQPFDDPSGDRLRRWMGVDRSVFYDAGKISCIPMAFCFPGSAQSGRGDAPPPRRCADMWRQDLLDALPPAKLTIILGVYATAWHLADRKYRRIVDAVHDHEALLPDRIVLPHPSPRNALWLKNNPWFEADAVPRLQRRVASLLTLTA